MYLCVVFCVFCGVGFVFEVFLLMLLLIFMYGSVFEGEFVVVVYCLM